MTRKYTIQIRLRNRKVRVYGPDIVAGFEPMNNGLFYVQLNDIVGDVKGFGVNAKQEVTYDRYWYSPAEIESVHVTESVRFDDEAEILKYQKFKSRGIDLVHQAISNTTVDKTKATAEVEADPEVKVIVEKVAREQNKKERRSN